MSKVFNAGDVLPASDLNTNMMQPHTAGTGTRIIAGKTAFTITAAVGTSITVTYGVTFSALTALILTTESSASVPVFAYQNGAAGTSNAGVRVENPAGTSITRSGTVNWIAIGTP